MCRAPNTDSTQNRLYEICSRGVWLCQKYEAAQMRKQEPRIPNGSYIAPGKPQRGAIVNTASICGSVAMGMPSYTAAKHSVLGITKVGGLFYGKHGIRCNSLSPGVVLTPELLEWQKAFVDDERFHEQATGFSTRCPLKRPSHSDEQGNVASFLLSGESSFINCANIVVDGGLTVAMDR
jgi:NAD(P)-dependent dehydrogenase (short-subunit alcohol dehydrogenase family)